MTKVTPIEALISLGTAGKFGYSCGFGKIRFGYTRFGYFTEYAGIYQRHRVQGGWGISRMIHYRPTNPRTPTQQAWRTVFADAWSVYNSLTDSEKRELYREAVKRGMTGPNLFMSRWLQSRRAGS